MVANIYILALFFFTICSAQTYYTGGGQNFTDPKSWSAGAPTPSSIVIINETACNGCTIDIDEDMEIAELHLIASTGNGPNINLVAAQLTISGVLIIGSSNVPATSSYYTAGITISEGSVLELGENCATTIYYVGNYPIDSYDNQDNWFINRGTITVLSNGAIAAGSSVTMSIGRSSSYPLYIDNYGIWDVSSGQVGIQFYYIPVFNTYRGSLNGVQLQTTGTSYPSIQFYGTNVVFQEVPAEVTQKRQPVNALSTFEGLYFYSVYSQGYDDYNTPSTLPNTLIFNASDYTVSDSLFYATNIVFLADGTLENCKLTYYTLVNSSSSVAEVTAHFSGDSNVISDTIFSGIDLAGFRVVVDETATLEMNSVFSLFGPVTFLNYGNFTFNSNSYMYFDEASLWVNLGIMRVINYSNDYIQGSSFPGLAAATKVGTLANMGTIEFTDSGALNFQSGTGNFYQCKRGILKFGYGYPAAGDYPATTKFANVLLDGYLGFAFNEDTDVPTDGTDLFTFVPEEDGEILKGSFGSLFDTVVKGPGIFQSSRLVCFEAPEGSTTGTASVYDLSDQKICPTDTYQTAGIILVGDACSSLPEDILALEDTAPCRAGANCGIDTGVPIGEPTPSGSPANIASLAFIVSLVCLLLKF